MGKLLLLAIAAAVYPTLLAMVILVLGRPRPVHLLAAFLAGAIVVSLAVGLAILFVLKDSGAVDTSSHRSVSPAVDVAVGLISLAVAVGLATGRDKPFTERRRARKEAKADPSAEPRDAWTTRLMSRDSLLIAFALGIVLDLPSVFYLDALKEIAKASHPTSVDVLLVVLFNVVMFAALEVPLVAYILEPERSAAAVERVSAWLSGHMRQIGVGIAGALGLYLFVSGLVDLLT
jgi:hypothetical protein